MCWTELPVGARFCAECDIPVASASGVRSTPRGRSPRGVDGTFDQFIAAAVMAMWGIPTGSRGRRRAHRQQVAVKKNGRSASTALPAEFTFQVDTETTFGVLELESPTEA
jgi:hypothetical protein